VKSKTASNRLARVTGGGFLMPVLPREGAGEDIAKKGDKEWERVRWCECVIGLRSRLGSESGGEFVRNRM
jgi:hypothetical protein